YRINLVNSGDQPATNVVVQDVIPAGTTYVPGSMAVRGQPVTDAADGDAGEFVAAPPTAMFRLSSLDNRPGSNEILLSFQVDIGNLTQPVTIANQAIVRADRIPDFPLTSEVPAYPRLKQVVVTPDRLVIKSNIHFEFDRNEVRSDSYPVLDEIVSVMNTYPDLRIRIEGHTDAVGTRQYNEGLSDRRATAVRRFLVGRGVSADRIEWVGRGEAEPVGDNITPLGRAKNRRMEFAVLNPEALKLDQKATEVRVEPTPYEPDLAMESEPAWLQGKDLDTPALRRRARLDE
ncbi:MAG: OmpA family protein, partial [Candidatus Binatia bacterium]